MVDYSSYTSLLRPELTDYIGTHTFIITIVFLFSNILLIPMLLGLLSIIVKPLKRIEILYNILFLTLSFFLLYGFHSPTMASSLLGFIVIIVFNAVFSIKNMSRPKIILFYFSSLIYILFFLMLVTISRAYFMIGVGLCQPLGYVFFLKPKTYNYIIQGLLLIVSLILAFTLKWVEHPEGFFGIVYPYEQIDPMLFSTVYIDIWYLCLLCHIIMYVVTFFRLISTEKRKISELHQNDDISIDSAK